MSANASAPRVPTDEIYRFQLFGDHYEIVYAGHRIHLKDSVGLTYINRLIEDPFKDIPILQLVHGAASKPGEKDDTKFALQTGLTITDLTERAEGIEKRLRAARERAAACKYNGDTLGLIEAEDLINALEESAHENGPVAKALNSKGSLVKAKDAVRKAISRAIDGIRKHCPPLARHLRRSISGGNRYSYEPEHLPEWIL